jgi:hypothetical protein
VHGRDRIVRDPRDDDVLVVGGADDAVAELRAIAPSARSCSVVRSPSGSCTSTLL